MLTAALGRAGWSVTEVHGPSNGQMGAAIGAFGDALADSPGASALVYACGYGVGYERRLFLLPTSANLARETDVLTAGVVGAAVTGPVARSKVSAGLVALDLVALDLVALAGAAPVAAESAQLRSAAPRTGVVAVVNAVGGPAAPTGLASALAGALGQPSVTVSELLAGLQRSLAGSGCRRRCRAILARWRGC